MPASSVISCAEVALQVLTDICSTISKLHYNNFLLDGDMNTNLYNDNDVAKLIRQFLVDYDLVIANDVIKTNCNYTYYHETTSFQLH